MGAGLYYLSFVFDCVDGKLARLLAVSSPRGIALDAMADGARRLSAALGVTAYLWRTDAGAEIWWAILYGLAASYFMEVSGDPVPEPVQQPGSRWARFLVRRRLLARPGMPDVSAIVYVIGPLSGLVVPALIVGLCLVALAILRGFVRVIRE